MIWLILGLGSFFITLNGETILNKVEENLPDWTKYDSLFKKYAARDGLDWTWLKAIAMNESSLGRAKSVMIGEKNPNDTEGSKSFDGLSWGLMQVTLNTGRDYDKTITPQKLNNAEYSVDIASRFLKSLTKQFPTPDARYIEWIIKSYNQGAGNTNKERSGRIKGYAQEYWERFQRNLKRVNDSL